MAWKTCVELDVADSITGAARRTAVTMRRAATSLAMSLSRVRRTGALPMRAPRSGESVEQSSRQVVRSRAGHQVVVFTGLAAIARGVADVSRHVLGTVHGGVRPGR